MPMAHLEHSTPSKRISQRKVFTAFEHVIIIMKYISTRLKGYPFMHLYNFNSTGITHKMFYALCSWHKFNFETMIANVTNFETPETCSAWNSHLRNQCS